MSAIDNTVAFSYYVAVFRDKKTGDECVCVAESMSDDIFVHNLTEVFEAELYHAEKWAKEHDIECVIEEQHSTVRFN